MPKILVGSMLSVGREKLIAEAVKHIDKTGARFIYLVPTAQLQKEVESSLTRAFNDQSHAGTDNGGRDLASQDHSKGSSFAVPGLRVLMFDGFVNELLKDASLYRVPIRPYQQRLVLKELTAKLYAENQFACLSEMINRDGFYTSLLEWLKEVKRTGLSAEAWLAHASTDKERELGFIYQAYEEFLTATNLTDTERNYANLLEWLPSLAGSSTGVTSGIPGQTDIVIVDGFYKLNQLQLRFIAELLELGLDVIVHTFLEDERQELFLSTQEMVQQLQQMANGKSWRWEIERLDESDLTTRPETLNHLKRQLFNVNAVQIEGNAALEIVHTPDPYREIMEIGRRIKQSLLKDQECKLDEIAVIFRNVEYYHGYVEEIFGELGISFEISTGAELRHTPVFKLILKIYKVLQDNWSRESVIEILKSQYLQIAEAEEAELFEQIILTAGIIGGREEWQQKLARFRTRLERELQHEEKKAGSNSKLVVLRENLATLERLGKVLNDLFPRLNSLYREKTVLKHAKALLEFFVAYGLEQQVLHTGDAEVLRRDLKSLGNLRRLLEEIVRLGKLLQAYRSGVTSIPVTTKTLGNAEWQLAAQEFLEALSAGAEEVIIPEPRAKYDAVQILTPSESRGYHFKLVFIGGLLEGEFPWYGYRDWLFKPEERRILKGRGIYFKQFYERLEEERLFFLEAVNTASEQLVLSCPGLQSDDAVQASSFLQETLNLFTEESISSADVVPGMLAGLRVELEQALTRRELEEVLLQELCVSMGNLENLPAYQEIALAAEPGVSRALLTPEMVKLAELYWRGEMVRLREGQSFSEYDGLCTAEAIRERLQQMYHAGKVYSISQINDYAVCPFQFFAKRILGLDEVEEPVLRLEPLDLGNIYHQVLFLFFRDFPGWREESLEAALERICDLATQVMANYPAGFSLPVGLWTIYQEEIVENLQRILTFEYQEAEKQEFQLKPTYFEASFGLYREYQEEGTLNHPDPVVIHRVISESTDSTEAITVKFSGKIDRIDQSSDGRYLVIYDYKLGRREGFEEMDAGIDLQLPVYIKAVSMLCGEDKEVLGAGYFSLLKCDRKSGVWRNVREDLIPVTSRSKSCRNEADWQDFLQKVDGFIIDYINRIKAGDFQVNPQKCPDYCKFKQICRFDAPRIRRKTLAGIGEDVQQDIAGQAQSTVQKQALEQQIKVNLGEVAPHGI